MDDLIRYCCDKGLHHFTDFKFERKSRIVMKEHFVSNKDVIKFNLYSYVQPDRYGRYKLPKYFLRKFSNLISDCMEGWITTQITGYSRKRYTIYEVYDLLLNPNGEVKCLLDKIQEDLDKDIVRTRIMKIWNIKNKMKHHE